MKNKAKQKQRVLLAVGITGLLGVLFIFSMFLERNNEETPIVVTTMPDIPFSYAQGESLYQTNCSTCHGPTLGGRKGLGPPFVHGYYKPSHHSDIAFYRAVEQGVTAHHWQFGNMPAVPSLSKPETAEIIKYIRAVQRHNGVS
jgi:cytochrome c2